MVEKKEKIEEEPEMKEEYKELKKDKVSLDDKSEWDKEKPKKSKKKDLKVKVWEFKCYSGLLKKLVHRVKPISDEFKLIIGKEGISTKIVDPAHVAMMHLEIPRKDFYTGNSAVNKNVEYIVRKEGVELGLSADKLDRTLKLFNEYDYVTGYVQGNSLYLDTDKIHKKIQLLDARVMPNLIVPDISFDVEAKIGSSEMSLVQKAISDQEYLTLIADKTGLYLIVDEEEDSLRVDLSGDVKGTGKALYSCDYFSNLIGSGGHSTILEFTTDQPVKITSGLCDTGNFMCLLAPRIEGEKNGMA